VDEIIPEPLGGAHKDPAVTAANVKKAILRALNELNKLSREGLAEDRYRKFRSMGVFSEPAESKKPQPRKRLLKDNK
jgi:acetyl-CoA carboxylase carboxyl transferase subunit alpha